MYFLFDIGGTNMRVCVSTNGRTLDAVKILPTPSNFEDGLRAFRALADELRGGTPFTGACGGMRGILNRAKTEIARDSLLPDWVGKPLSDRIGESISAPVILENDAALAGLGEAALGAGKGQKIVAYLTIGTGVGGVRITNSRIDTNAYGFEPGHQILSPTPITLPDETTLPATLENLVSGSALQKKFGKPAEEISDRAVWKNTTQWLARGIHNTIVHWSPDVVILGGAVMQKIPIEHLTQELRRTLTIFPNLPELKPSTLGSSAGLQGALVYANQKIPG